MSARRRISSGGPWEAAASYSRAVVVGDTCWVSGTTDAGPGGRSQHPGDAAAQALASFATCRTALEAAGFAWEDVVRTRMFVVDRADADRVATVHGELFADIRPAATLLVVAALMDPSLLVEVEVEARRG